MTKLYLFLQLSNQFQIKLLCSLNLATPTVKRSIQFVIGAAKLFKIVQINYFIEDLFYLTYRSKSLCQA